MLKKAVAVLLCAVFLTAFLPVICNKSEAFAFESDFGDRIMYGGTAVDIGSDTVFNRDGAIYKKYADGKEKLLTDTDGKYLNYFDGALWFASGNSIMRCEADGSGLETVLSFNSEVKCLYVTDAGMMYLRNETVYRYSSQTETAVLTRQSIEGFVPESDGSIRWIKRNPEYIPNDLSGDEVWSDGNDEYCQYLTSPDSNFETDTVAVTRVYGTELLTNDTSDYWGPYVQIGETTLPLENHMPGTFFSKNGQACTCHNTAPTYCIQSVGNCNCMRYYPTGIKETCEVDLLGAQCFAFARMVFWKCFGFIDHSNNSSLYYNVGTLSSGAVTANSVKELLMKAAPGAHVRLSAGHSMSVLTMDEDFIVFYHGNAGGDGVASAPCVISTRRYTWEQFAKSAALGIQYINMPYNYPDSEIILTKKEAGYYKLNAYLNLREETNTSSESLAVMEMGRIIEVTEIDGFWGKTEYNGITGWVFLEYTTFFSRKEILPSGDVFALDKNGYLRATEWRFTLDSFSEHFDKQSITVKNAKGEEISLSGYIGTGSTVTLEVNGNIIDSARVCLAGDVNCNGALDVGDYILIKRACMSTYTFSDIQNSAADVYGNNGVDSADYLMIKRYFFTPEKALFSDFMSYATE